MIETLYPPQFPFLLQNIHDPPRKLYVEGSLPPLTHKVLCVVGSRTPSSYGEEACKKLIAGLKGYDISIISGLALGIDGIAHRAALEAGLHTVAFPGSGLDPKALHPKTHHRLANEILYAGGALVSEFDHLQHGTDWTFPKRNRLMSGISDATLVIEARMLSGSLITARDAMEQNRPLGVVPGSIFSELSEGPHSYLREGATPVMSVDDILGLLGLGMHENGRTSLQPTLLLGLSEEEQKLVELLRIESRTIDELIATSGFAAREVNEMLSRLEIEGVVKERNGRIFMA